MREDENDSSDHETNASESDYSSLENREAVPMSNVRDGDLVQRDNVNISQGGSSVESVETTNYHEMNNGEDSHRVGDRRLTIGCWNVGGLFRNHPQIFKSCAAADVICLLETFLEAETAPHIRIPDDCHALHIHGKRNRGARRASGGYLLLIKNHVARPTDCSFSEHSPGIGVAKIKLISGQSLACIFVYRAADSKSAVYDADFLVNLSAVLAAHGGDNVLLCGDFNIKMGDMTGPLGLLDFADDILPAVAESPEIEGPAEELFEVLTSSQMYAIFDNRDGTVRDTFRCRTVSGGGSLIDFVYANSVLFPVVSHMNSEFRHPCNHSMNLVYLDAEVPDLTPNAVNQAMNRMRVVDMQKLMELEHTPSLKDLAHSADGFDAQSAANAIAEFVEKFTTVIVTKVKKERPIESVETLDAKRTARRIERRLKTERDAARREQLRVDWLVAVENWRRGRERDENETVAEARENYYEAIRNKNLYKAWRIARRNTAGKGGGIRDKVTSFISSEQWEDHFSRLFSDPNGQNVSLQAPRAGKTVSLLDTPFTGEEVARALETKKTHRALGPDGFSIDHLRILRYDETTCAALANFMTLCFRTAEIPNEWSHAFLFILYKGSGPKDDANNFRGITLKSQLLKLFESMLCARLRKWAEMQKILPPEQIAYRPGHNGSDHLYSLTLLREHFNSPNSRLHAGFVDLRKAFPSVNRQRLLDELSRLGVSDPFLRVLTRLYSGDSFSILLDGRPSSRIFEVSNGVHEGSPLSPLLFIIFIAGLTRHLNENHNGDGVIRLADGTRLLCLLYADDVLLVALTSSGLQKLVEESCRFFQTMGLTVNPTKSDIVIFLRGRPQLQQPSFDIAGLQKEAITEAKYLGVVFQHNGSWKEQMAVTLSRCRMARGRCRVICSSLGFAKPRPLIQVYDTFVSAIYRYSLGTWGILVGDLSKIDNLFCDFVKQQYKLPVSTCRKSILMQFARRCASCDARYLAAVQLARGLCNPSSVWARVLATAWGNGREWLGRVRAHLQLLGIENVVMQTPACFLSDRRKYETDFSIWCHEHHLSVANGSSADYFRQGRPFGFYPAVFDVPASRARSMLTLLLSCWKWTADLRNCPDYCSVCDCEMNSEHVMFGCINTREIRRRFEVRTGRQFVLETFQDENLVTEIANACNEIVDNIRARFRQ